MSEDKKYYVGLDLGQARDYSALAIAEATGEGKDCVCLIRHLERWQLGTSYPAICSDALKMVNGAPLEKAKLIVDATGVGRPVVDLIRPGLGPRLCAVTITGGVNETREIIRGGSWWTVPKRNLVSTAQVMLQSRRLKIAASLPEAATLTRELEGFQVKIDSETAHDSYGAWRTGAHDDLVLAVALAIWGALNPSLNRVLVGA